MVAIRQYIGRRVAREALVHYRRAFQLDTSRLLSAQPLVQEYVLNTSEAGERDSAFAAVARMAAGNHASQTLGVRLSGLLLLREGRADSAIRMLWRATQQSAPLGLASVVRNAVILARTLGWSGRHEEARAVLRDVRVTALNFTLPPDWPARVAAAAWDMGDSVLAREMAAKALQGVTAGSKLDQRTRLLTSAALALERDARRAIALADSAAVGQPNATVELMRGRAHEAAGDIEQALRIYGNAGTLRRCCYENYFDVTEARFAAARLAMLKGDTLAARTHVRSQLNEWASGDTIITAHRWALRLLGPPH